MVRKKRLQAEKAGSRLISGVCPFRSCNVTNYTVPTRNLDSPTGSEIMNFFILKLFYSDNNSMNHTYFNNFL